MAVTKKKIKKSKPNLGGLLLEDGSFWPGRPFGAQKTKLGECVFHTAHIGYQEILTDPSYYKQILVFSQVQIGNQGFSDEDFESARIWASGCVTRSYSEALFHWRRQKSLDDVLKENECPALFGIDTRRLILHLREKGNLWGVISTETNCAEELSKYLKKNLSMEGLSLTADVTTSLTFHWAEGSKHLAPVVLNGSGQGLKRCVVMDFGVKRQILRYLIDAGFKEVIVVPAKTKAKDILALKPEALLLSNGPGDPAADPQIVEEVRSLLKEEIPTLGICLGHQILGLALGLQTYKLKFGHHGANHPVKNLLTDRVEITSHNHGFAVRESRTQSEFIESTHINLNDSTLEGFRHKRAPFYAIQFHPESSPGPIDSVSIFKGLQQGFPRDFFEQHRGVA